MRLVRAAILSQIVRGVMADVQQRGWDAVVEYAERFDGKAPYIVEPKVLDDAYNACDPKLIAALEKAAGEHPRLPRADARQNVGVEPLGGRNARPDRARTFACRHLCAGRHGAYPSSVLMNAIPAKVAGVGELIMVTPPTENMSNEVLAAAKIAGVDTVIAIGGTQAIAALTYGAGFIPQVDKIVGPATPLLRQPRSWRSARRYRHDRRSVRGAGHCRPHRQPDLRCRPTCSVRPSTTSWLPPSC